jgi:hypothetical protein
MTRNGTLFQLRPLVRRTGGNECGLWRTPSAAEPGVKAERLISKEPGGQARHYDKETGRLAQIGLSQQVQLRQMYPTPSASQMPCEGTVRLARKAWLDGTATLEEANAIAGRDVRDKQGKVPAMWPTPRVSDIRDGRTLNEDGCRVSPSGIYGANLSDLVQVWPTPNAGKAANEMNLRCSGDGRTKPNKLGWAVAKADSVPIGGQLNPTWVEWLMGFPLGWTALDASETPLSRKSLRSSGEQSLTESGG